MALLRVWTLEGFASLPDTDILACLDLGDDADNGREVNRSNDLANDYSLTIDEECGRITEDPELDASPRTLVDDNNLVGRTPEFVEERDRIRLCIFVIDRNEPHSFIREVFRRLNELRMFCSTREAPRGPEIDDQDVSREIGEAD